MELVKTVTNVCYLTKLEILPGIWSESQMWCLCFITKGTGNSTLAKTIHQMLHLISSFVYAYLMRFLS